MNKNLNLEKLRGISGQMRKVIVNEKDISDEKRINEEIEKFYETLFKEKVENTSTEHTLFLATFSLAMLKENEILLCEEDLTEKELYEVIMSVVQQENTGKRWIDRRVL